MNGELDVTRSQTRQSPVASKGHVFLTSIRHVIYGARLQVGELQGPGLSRFLEASHRQFHPSFLASELKTDKGQEGSKALTDLSEVYIDQTTSRFPSNLSFTTHDALPFTFNPTNPSSDPRQCPGDNLCVRFSRPKTEPRLTTGLKS